MTESSGPNKKTSLKLPDHMKPKLVDAEGDQQIVSVKEYYNTVAKQARKSRNFNAEGVELFPFEKETDLTITIAMLYSLLGNLYPEPVVAQAQLLLLLNRLLEIHLELSLTLCGNTEDEEVLNAKIVGMLKEEHSRLAATVSTTLQRDRNASLAKTETRKLPVKTNADIVELRFNLDQMLKDDNVGTTNTFQYCKNKCVKEAEDPNNCHPELLSAVGLLKQFTHGKSMRELQGLSLDDFIAVCNFGSVVRAPIPYQLMACVSKEKKTTQTNRQFQAEWETEFQRFYRQVEIFIANLSPDQRDSARTVHDMWKQATRLAHILKPLDEEMVNKLATEMHSREITRENALDHQEEINVLLQTILDEVDRDKSRKRVAFTLDRDHKDLEKSNVNLHKRNKRSERPDVENATKRISKEQKRLEMVKKFPSCADCMKRAGHEFHKYVTGSDGKQTVCPKAPTNKAYLDGFKEFLARPSSQRAVTPIA